MELIRERKKYYRRVKKNQVDGFHTIEDLVRIFKLKDERRIIAAFGDNITVLDKTLVLESKYLIDRLGFDPTEPFVTRREAMDSLGINHAQIMKLIKKRALPTFQLQHAQGSSTLLLQRDVEKLKQTLVVYNNSPELLIDHNKKLVKALAALFEYDGRHLHAINGTETELSVAKAYFLENKSLDEMAAELNLNRQTIQNYVTRTVANFDSFFRQVSLQFQSTAKLRTNIKKLQTDNAHLQSKNEQLEQFIKRTMPESKPAQFTDIFDADLIKICHALSAVKLSSISMSVRLGNVIKPVQKYYINKYKPEDPAVVNTFKWLLEFPIDELYRFTGFGKRCRDEVEQIIVQRGFKPNQQLEKISIDAGNVLRSVSDRQLALGFYKEWADKAYLGDTLKTQI